MARILWIASWEPGGMFPAVPIALELLRRGHHVTALCDADSRPQFERLGCAFVPTTELSRHLASFDPAAHDAPRQAWHAGYVQSLFADTTRALTPDFDLALVDPLEPGAEFAAEAHGIRTVSYVHWRMDENGADVPFCFRFWDGTQPAAEAFVEWWNGQRALVGLPPEPRPADEHRWYRNSPHLALLLGLPELVHPPGPLPSYALRVGPTLWEPPLEEPLPPWVAELGRARPAVLASVSTVGPLDLQLLEAVASAVPADVDVVATTSGAGQLPELPPNVRVLPFVPHGALLPRVSAVVSHAGNGTVTRAACAGVPLLLLPEGKDQFEVARGAEAAGIALTVDRDDLPGAGRAMRRLLTEPAFRERARAIAERAGTYGAPRAAVDAIEALVDD